MSISRNPEFYTTGVPKVFMFQVANPDEPGAVDHIALYRAFTGVADLTTGTVTNSADENTCMTPYDIIKQAYIGNLPSVSQGGDVSTVEHKASENGRSVVDKVILTQRSVNYTVGFDEVSQQNLQRFFSAVGATRPSVIAMSGPSTHKIPQQTAGEFLMGAIEATTVNFSSLGNNLDSFGNIAQSVMVQNGMSFPKIVDGGTDYYWAGVCYFLVGDNTRSPDVDSKLTAYRNKILAVYLKYNPLEGKLEANPFPARLDTAAYVFENTTIDPKVKFFRHLAAETPVGVVTNNSMLNKADAARSASNVTWQSDASSAATHVLTVQMPKNIAHNSVSVSLRGQKWNSTANAWEYTQEYLGDVALASGSTGTAGVLASTSSNPSYFADELASTVNYVTGEVKITIGAQLIVDATTNNLNNQDIEVIVEAYTASDSLAVWSGTLWTANAEIDTMRVMRGRSELSGCCLIVHHNDVGVSSITAIPRATMRPDGTLSFAKDDWVKGQFIISCIKRDQAQFPKVPFRVPVPFGFTSFYRFRTSDAE